MQQKTNFLYHILFLIGLISLHQKSYGQAILPPTLHCVDVDENSGNRVTLEWESNSNCGVDNSEFIIYVSNAEDGIYVIIDTVDGTTTTYTHNNPLVTPTDADPLFYSIVEVCPAGRSDLTATIVGTSQPITPELLSVTIRTDSTVEVIWDPRETLTAVGYIISRSNENGSIVDIDTFLTSEISPNSAARYIDALPSTIPHPIEYIIAAFNRCSQRTPGILAHATMGLTVIAEGCDDQALLSWTPYQGWGADNALYQVVFIDENGRNTIIDTVQATDPTNYIYTIPSNFTEGSFKINALRLDRVRETGFAGADEQSCSNIVPLNVDAATGPAYICVTNATVNENGFVDLVWQIDDTQARNSLMYRSWTNNQNENPQSFSLISDALPTTAEMNVRDETANTNNAFYNYRIVHNDKCNRETLSGTVTTMFLRAEDAFNFTNRLIWNPFVITNGVVNTYRIYRRTVEETEFEQIEEINAPIGNEKITYLDSNLGEVTRQYCYKIEALYSIDCPEANFVADLSSFSNATCVNQASRIIVPNAFTPNEATNNIFKPTIVFPNSESYQMIIANRWGENIYLTTNPDEGWNGMLRDDLAPQGVYLYYITMTTVDGFNIKRQGSLLLIR